MRRTTTLLAAACLALAGCSSGGEPDKESVTVTATKTRELSDAEARQACVDAWLAVMTADNYDPERGLQDRPSECEGVTGQAAMYAEALQERNAANREELDACLEDPACTEMPVP